MKAREGCEMHHVTAYNLRLHADETLNHLASSGRCH